MAFKVINKVKLSLNKQYAKALCQERDSELKTTTSGWGTSIASLARHFLHEMIKRHLVIQISRQNVRARQPESRCPNAI